MKFYFGRDKSPSSSPDATTTAAAANRIHKNLFDSSSSTTDEDDDEDSNWHVEDTTTSTGVSGSSSSLSMPLSDTIAEYAHDLTDDQFFLDDLSFVFELSRKRALSPYAILVALLYMKRLKQKTLINDTTSTAPYCIDSYSSRNVIDSYFLKENNSSDPLENLTNSELCLVSMLLASKYLIDEGEDEEIYNDEWAKAAHVPTAKINKLERLVLARLDWELYVSSDEFWSFTNQLTERITLKKVKLQLDNCTYSDLDVLLTGDAIKLFNSVESARYLLLLLAKILVLCTSTLVYVALSSYLASSCALYVKNDLTLAKHVLSLVGYWSPLMTTTTTTTIPVNHMHSTDLNVLFPNSLDDLEDLVVVDHHHHHQNNVSSASYLQRLEKRICSLNDKIKSFLNLNKKIVFHPRIDIEYSSSHSPPSFFFHTFSDQRQQHHEHFVHARHHHHHTAKQFEFNQRHFVF